MSGTVGNTGSPRRGAPGAVELFGRYWVPYRQKVALGVFFKAFEVVLELLTPLVIARMIDVGIGEKDMSLIVRMAALLCAFAVGGYLCTLICQKMAAVVSQGMGTDLRHAMYEKINALSAAEVDRTGAPSLVTRLLNDINQIQLSIALFIRGVTRWPFLAIGSVVCAVLVDARLGLVLVVATPLILLVFFVIIRLTLPLYSVVQARLDRLSQLSRESISGARVIRAFGGEAADVEKFGHASKEQASVAIFAGRLSSLLNPLTSLVMNLAIVCVLWVGGLRVNAGSVTTGEVVAFVNYMNQTLIAVIYLTSFFVTITRGHVSSKRVLEVIDTEPAVRGGSDHELAVECGAGRPLLALDGVCFSYGQGDDALSDVSLSVLPGETLGIIGGTGAGKSTLVALLSRLYDPTEGSIELMGHDVREYPLGQLRRLVSVVPQRARLVSGTLRENLCWRDEDATDDELWHALEVAQARDFVEGLDDGLDTQVDVGGRNFSGGQRQRLTIARALVGSPSLVVLDDSASALDFATDARLRRALSDLDMVRVIISQRVSAVMGADKILVLEHGRQVGMGTHDELLSSCAYYREIASTQLKGVER